MAILEPIFEAKAKSCYIIDNDIPLQMMAFTEPLACALRAVNRAGDIFGKRVLVTGAGPIGLLVALLAKQAGAIHTTITDIEDFNLRLAQEIGIDAVLNVAKKSLGGSLGKSLDDIPPVDVVIEASGNSQAFLDGLSKLERKGVMVQISVMRDSTVSIPLNQMVTKELDIRGIFRYSDDFYQAYQLIQAKRIDLSPLLTHQFTLQQGEEAFKTALGKASIKVQLLP